METPWPKSLVVLMSNVRVQLWSKDSMRCAWMNFIPQRQSDNAAFSLSAYYLVLGSYQLPQVLPTCFFLPFSSHFWSLAAFLSLMLLAPLRRAWYLALPFRNPFPNHCPLLSFRSFFSVPGGSLKSHSNSTPSPHPNSALPNSWNSQNGKTPRPVLIIFLTTLLCSWVRRLMFSVSSLLLSS